MKKLLILGGTNFIGRYLTERLLESSGYEITLFNRGYTNAHLFPEVNRIYGDRHTKDINLLANKKWDVVIDISCYFPDFLENILRVLQGNVDRYIFISTCSVYLPDKNNKDLLTENDKILDCSEKEKSDTSFKTYGKRKAECERVLIRSEWVDKIIIRPALVYGRYDDTDRMYYWIYRSKFQDKILTPNYGDNLASYTYIEDLVNIIIKSISVKKHFSVYNVTSFPRLSIKEVISSASEIFNRSQKLVSADYVFLFNKNIKQWTDIPLWINGDYYIFDNHAVKNDYNYEFPYLKTTLTDTIKYYEELNWEFPVAGISLKKEKELISELEAGLN
ncbi:MAG: NAD-dependent epimerase/dehydratase family protein [Bacteroidales bacterium]|nr:MAG: NAD-dependent epimerase/dehydratase family protein [Bacteroidales bacterium]